MSSNRVIKNRRNIAPLLTKRYITNIKFILTFKIVIPIKYNRYYRLNLPDCKVASKSKLYNYSIVTNKIIYSSYNVYRNNPSVLYRVLNEKKHLNVKECKTTLLLHDITSKLLYLKD